MKNAIYDKPIAKIISSGEILKTFPLKSSGDRDSHSASPVIKHSNENVH